VHQFVRNLITEWRRLELPVERQTLVVGVSGGADSVSLLLAIFELVKMGKLDLRLVAAHFNHALRDGESDRDEQFVREFTAQRRIEFASGRAKALDAGNLEQNARVARYDFLNRVADGVDAFAILTGHTLNDQAETFLMNLIRGSGPEGLCGMKTVRPIDEEVPSRSNGCETTDETAAPAPLLFADPRLLVRPLLTWAKREQTEQYCLDSHVEYRYDTMNEDTALRRVRIRKILLPILEDMNPKIVETLANTASLMQGLPQNAPISRNRLPPTDELIIGEIRSLPKPELYLAVRSWLRQHRGDTRQLQLKHVQAIERLVYSDKSGRIVELPGGRVVKSGGKLQYEKIGLKIDDETLKMKG
jgi:tRNA(Ile)-lysidine synthase